MYLAYPRSLALPAVHLLSNSVGAKLDSLSRSRLVDLSIRADRRVEASQLLRAISNPEPGRLSPLLLGLLLAGNNGDRLMDRSTACHSLRCLPVTTCRPLQHLVRATDITEEHEENRYTLECSIPSSLALHLAFLLPIDSHDKPVLNGCRFRWRRASWPAGLLARERKCSLSTLMQVHRSARPSSEHAMPLKVYH